MLTDPGWLWISDRSEPDYDDWIVETESMQEMMMDVETYDDYFVEELN